MVSTDRCARIFHTTDNPLVREIDPKSISPSYGDGGFYNKTANHISVVTDETAFHVVGTFAHTVKPCSRDYVECVNKALAVRSDQYLYSHIHHKRLEQLAAEFKHSRPGITTQGFGPSASAPSR